MPLRLTPLYKSWQILRNVVRSAPSSAWPESFDAPRFCGMAGSGSALHDPLYSGVQQLRREAHRARLTGQGSAADQQLVACHMQQHSEACTCCASRMNIRSDTKQCSLLRAGIMGTACSTLLCSSGRNAVSDQPLCVQH